MRRSMHTAFLGDMMAANHVALSELAPLVVDLDGTLTPTDTLIESLVELVKANPLCVLSFPRLLFYGKSALKDHVASRVEFSATQLPYRETFLDYLRQQQLNGRRIILATAAHKSIADKVALHLGLFDTVIATDTDQNLKGRTKLRVIKETVGDKFVYAGDCKADLPIWEAAEAAILVGASPKISSAVRSTIPIEQEFLAEPVVLKDWLKALRVYQWIKNLLIFVPLLTSFGFADPIKALDVCLAFLAFSFAASATYLVNDLWDINNDRAHPRKRHRAFASAKISIPSGLLVATALLGAALAIAGTLSAGFFISLIAYIVITSAYSWVLKTYVLIDVLTLSLLYTLRILAGSLAIGISTSSWLLAFSVFIFFSLAIVKRCAELVSAVEAGKTATYGRDYRVGDLTVLWPLGVGASLCSVVVFGLYINAGETQARYASPQLLWLVGVGLIYWVARLWTKTSRGEMHDDPIVFAVRDFGSRVTVLCMVAVTIVAYFIHVAGI